MSTTGKNPKLQGKVAVVTGAGRGIGAAIARRFARASACVALVSRTRSEIASQAQQINAEGGKALPIVGDVSNERSVEEIVRQVDAELGEIDILVNNAGVAIFKPIVETTPEEWDTMLNVNLKGVFLMTRAVLPSMMRRRAGRIINIASTASKKGYINQAAYCASKHGVLGFSKVLAMETQSYGIRVHAICPGGVDTRLVRNARDDVDFSQYMRPEEVAEVALFLATRDDIATIDEVVVRRFQAQPWAQ